MFQRQHHQRIHEILLALDGALLREHRCYFGGGTAIALQRDEYRESVDMDFMVSDLHGYRGLRKALQDGEALASFLGLGRGPLTRLPELRADQYGIRAWLPVKPSPIKFEIVFEARIELDTPESQEHICGISTLAEVDVVASKLLANADRWADEGVLSRDIIDLAMLQPTLKVWKLALRKAEDAYGQTVPRALEGAVDRLTGDPRRLARCMDALKIRIPPALIQQRLVGLRQIASA
jgi:hypothetical protein